MNTEDVTGLVADNAPQSYIAVSMAVGLLVGVLLSPFAQPFGLAAGLFGGSAVTFFAFLLFGDGP